MAFDNKHAVVKFRICRGTTRGLGAIAAFDVRRTGGGLAKALSDICWFMFECVCVLCVCNMNAIYDLESFSNIQ